MNCVRDRCGGMILDDGFCDQCWLAPRGVTPPATIGRSAQTRRATPSGSNVHSLGMGLVQLPVLPAIDPLTLVLADPHVPEQRRYCATCRAPVGRDRDGEPGMAAGFCPKCGAPYSFEPKLTTGDLVAGQYKVAGCLAHGGLGWVHLAYDSKVDNRWVVLKGLLRSGDRDAMTAALAERRFLAEVKHSNIVQIYNFVEHEGAGYIVMEYVNGTSLGNMLRRRRNANNGQADPLPIDEAIAYVLEILPALGHLHDRRLLFCDLKPDNIIRTDSSVKLIDLGGVYRMDDTTSPIYGTAGYQAPEIAHTGPTVATDIFTVGRTLAVLCTDFTGFQSDHRFMLRRQHEVPLYLEFDSLYRFLERATASDPNDRFYSASEARAQLLGVLREIVAARTGTPKPAASATFVPHGRVATNRPVWRSLPRPLVDPDDPGAGMILSFGDRDPTEVLTTLQAYESDSVEIPLWRVRTLMELGSLEEAEHELARIQPDGPWDWRVDWYRGAVALEHGDAGDAVAHFDVVYRSLPGELAPKLALGFAEEVGGHPEQAANWYQMVARTDPAFTAASFGLARCRSGLGDRDGAVDALDAVPDTSSAHHDACVTSVGLLVSPERGDTELRDVLRAARIVDRAALDPNQNDAVRASVLEAALRVAAPDRDPDADTATIFGVPLTERSLRATLESTYRSMARHAPSRPERIALVDRANQIRPRSLL